MPDCQFKKLQSFKVFQITKVLPDKCPIFFSQTNGAFQFPSQG